MNLARFEELFLEKVRAVAAVGDPAHDLLHFKRVVRMAKFLCEKEGARPEVVIPAAWLHDLVIVPKDDQRREEASHLSAREAVLFLKSIGYPGEYLEEIAHAIEAHSFSAGIEARTLEAKIVQDADRLDALGAIGIARCFATAGLLKRSFYSEIDPFCDEREADDSRFTLDHFFLKLCKIAGTLKTESGRREGKKRLEAMKIYLSHLREEFGSVVP